MIQSGFITIILLICLLINGGCKKNNNSNSNTNDSTTNIIQTYRPSYHFSPASTWTNDPNGLVYYHGAYHLFFQENPYGIVWCNMSWGHATSSDLLNWKQQALAIPEYTDANNNTINVFSGSAVVDSFSTSGLGNSSSAAPLIAVFTSIPPQK